MAMYSSAHRTRRISCSRRVCRRAATMNRSCSSTGRVQQQVRGRPVAFFSLFSPLANVDAGQSMTWTSMPQTGATPPSKRPRGRPRKTATTPPVMAQLAVKPAQDPHQPVPSSILSPPASVSSTSHTHLVHRNSTSPSTHHQTNNNLRYLNDNVLTPSSTSDTNVIARVPALFEQVKNTANESSFAVLSGVQNVLLSPNRDTNANGKRVRLESASSVVSTTTTTTTAAGKQVTLNVNALKPDFVRSPSAAQKPCPTTASSNQIDVISLVGTANNNQAPLLVTKSTPKAIAPAMISVPSSSNTDDYASMKSTTEPTNESSQALMIDFNDPSTTNFLLSALASGASSDSNAIVNHLFQKAQSQQQRHAPSPPLPPAPAPQVTIRKKVPILSAGLKNCTETTNLLPTATMRQPMVLHVPSNTIANNNDYHSSSQPQQIIFSSHNEDRKQPQQIFFINNKPYVIQQKLTHDQSSQQRLVLTPSICQNEGQCDLLSSDKEIRFENLLSSRNLRVQCRSCSATSRPHSKQRSIKPRRRWQLSSLEWSG